MSSFFTQRCVRQIGATSPKEAGEEAKETLAEKKKQIQRWQDALRTTFPLAITRLEVKHAQVNYIDRTRQPPIEMTIREVDILAKDLQNRPTEDGQTMPASVDVTGRTTGDGELRISLKLDPVAYDPHFALTFELRNQQLPPINHLLLAYADADVSRGTVEVFSEINAEDGAYNGYLKPLFRDLNFQTASDKNKNVGEVLKEKLVETVASMLKNEAVDQVATKAPFAGNFADDELDVWETIVNLLRNAFVQAIRGGLEGEKPSR